MITGCNVHFVGKTGKHYLATIEQEHYDWKSKTVSVDLIVFVRELQSVKFLSGVRMDQDDKAPGTFHWIEDWGAPPTFEELSKPNDEHSGDAGSANLQPSQAQ
ncbi:MAG: hypothetical protein HY868_25465 [Chloroflexi bacterium]|nr:hypothetical protein [Chloroflexota bacterium]